MIAEQSVTPQFISRNLFDDRRDSAVTFCADTERSSKGFERLGEEMYSSCRPLGKKGRREKTSKAACLHVSGDIPRADAVYLDIVLAPFVGQSLGKLAKSAFGGGICRDGETTLEGEKRAYVDDLAAAEGNHVLACSLGQDPADLEVNANNLSGMIEWGEAGRRRRTCIVPVGFRERYRGMATLDARAIDENVDIATHRVKSTGEKTANLVHVRQIAVQDSCRNTTSGNPIISPFVFDTISRRTVDKTDIGASLCERQGTRSTDAAGRACDENVAAAEVEERRGWQACRRIHNTEERDARAPSTRLSGSARVP